MIDVLVTAITLLVVGVVTLWSLSPSLRRKFEAPKHATLQRSRAYAPAESPSARRSSPGDDESETSPPETRG